MRLLFILLAAVFMVGLVSGAEFLNLEIYCDNDVCVPGRVATYNTTISNMGDDSINLLGYKIIDSLTLKSIIYREEEKPIQILPTKKYTTLVREKLPYPNYYPYSILNICLITEPELESWGQAGKRIEYCYDDINFSIEMIECLADYDCSENSICIDSFCVELNCSYCQYIDNHECLDYGCCKNDECPGEEECLENSCEDLKCGEEEYIVNHTCTKTACAHDEGVVNFTCVKLECDYDEYIKNHACVNLGCNEDEFSFNHTCVKLNCSYDEYASEHKCIKLGCEGTEEYLNHSCKEIKCNLFQKAEGHECRINSFLILVGFFLFMIYFLITLNIEKYIYLKRKKVINKFLKKKKKENKKISSQEADKNGKQGNPDGSEGEQSKDNDAGK